MSVNQPNFPTTVWDGLSPDRSSRLIDSPPSNEDWDQMVAELISVQTVVAGLGGGGIAIGAEIGNSPTASGVLYADASGDLGQVPGLTYNLGFTRLELEQQNLLVQDTVNGASIFLEGIGAQGSIIITSAVGNSSFLRFQGNSSAADMTYDDVNEILRLGWPQTRATQRGFIIQQGTGDPAIAGASVHLYSKDVTASAELFTKDEAGNVTQLSPHAVDLMPEDDAAIPLPLVIHHKNDYLGVDELINVSKLAKLVQDLTGQQVVWQTTFEKTPWDQKRAVPKWLAARGVQK